MGLPHTLKTDNGPTFTSKGFAAFLSDWNILHLRGIPYDPQGQAIIERAHRTLKLTLNKLKGGALYTKYGPKGYLPLTLFTIIFLNESSEKMTRDRRHFLNMPKSNVSEQFLNLDVWVKRFNNWKLGVLKLLGRGYVLSLQMEETSGLCSSVYILNNQDPLSAKNG